MIYPKNLNTKVNRPLIRRRRFIASIVVLPVLLLLPPLRQNIEERSRTSKTSIEFLNQWIYEFYFKNQKSYDLQKFDGDNKLGLLKLDEAVINMNGYLPADLRGGQHHSGTTRMGSSKDIGVVDKNLKVFDMRILYIVGSSVFPTNGWVNPTFTILALAHRLSDHIESTISAR